MWGEKIECEIKLDSKGCQRRGTELIKNETIFYVNYVENEEFSKFDAENED